MVTGLHLCYKATAKPWANLKTGHLERQLRDEGGGGLGGMQPVRCVVRLRRRRNSKFDEDTTYTFKSGSVITLHTKNNNYYYSMYFFSSFSLVESSLCDLQITAYK